MTTKTKTTPKAKKAPAKKPATKATPRKAVKAKTGAKVTKRDRLVALVTAGTLASKISKVLGWQPHTLRAAVSRLDFPVTSTRTPEGTVYSRGK